MDLGKTGRAQGKLGKGNWDRARDIGVNAKGSVGYGDEIRL